MADIQKHLERADKFASKNKFDAALEEYQAAYKLAPEELDLLRVIGDLCVRAGKPDQANRYYRELFDKYAGKNDITKAVALFRKSLQGVPQPPERYCTLGDLLRRVHKNNEAAEAYRTALKLFQKSGVTDGISECLESLASVEPDNPDVHTQLGEEALKAGKADRAAKAFLRAGQLLRVDDTDRALKLLQRAYELTPDRTVALSLAQGHLDKGSFEQAAELLFPLYAESDQDPSVLETLGQALLSADRLQEAEEVLEACNKVKPDSSALLFDLGGRYCQTGNPKRGVELLTRLKGRFFARRRERDYARELEKVFEANPSVTPLAEFAAALFNEVNQESRYARVLGNLFDLYFEAQDYLRAADTLERLIEIDPYDFSNQKHLEKLEGKLDDARYRAVASRITSVSSSAGSSSVYSGSEEAIEQAPAAVDPTQQAALLEDLIVQVEIFLQYSLKAKAIEKLQKIHQLFPGEESRNERLYKLYQRAQYLPKDLQAPAPPGMEPATALAAAPEVAPQSYSDLAKISEITHVLYRQRTPKTVLHAAVSELGKYLRVSRCLGTLGRPGAPPSTAVEYCAPGVPLSPGPTIVKLLAILTKVNVDPENGTVLDVSTAPDLKQVGVQSLLAMPLIEREKQEQEGVIILAQADRPRPWAPNEVYLLKAVADQTETAVSHTKLRSLMKSLSLADEATGLLGRGSYLDCLVSEVARSKSQGTPLVVALLDLDKGNQLLRQVGEAAMQKLMQQAGETMLSSLRQNDMSFRYTTTSLAIVLGDTTLEKVKPVVERLRIRLGALSLPGGKDSVSFSGGLSEAAIRPDYDPVDIVTDVVNRAEFSLEKARRKGDTTVVH